MIDRTALLKAGIGALFFVLVGLWAAMQRETLIMVIGWFSIIFGAIGFAAVFLQLTGLWRPREAIQLHSEQPGSHIVPISTNSHPVLSAAKKSSVRKIIALFSENGVFPLGAPEPEHLFEAVADQDFPVRQDTVLTALHEADYYHANFSAKAAWANLAFHNSNGEQLVETIQSQLDDLIRLADGALVAKDIAIDLDLQDGPGPHPPCTISMKLNDEKLQITYLPSGKYLSTYLHVAVARGLRKARLGKRLAWMWDDQGVWLSCLADGGVERLNEGPGAIKGGHGGWGWIDEVEPFAAGEV